MKIFNLVLLVTCASAAAVAPRHHNGRVGGKGKPNAASTSATATATTAASAAATSAASGAAAATVGQTLVLKEVNGVPGNECLTFRNNGEIVDAACVNTAADRQVTPATISSAAALKVQRTFTAGFRADLVGVDACVGFNGTHFKAEPCGSTSAGGAVEPVSFVGGQLKAAGGACASGHDSLAQLVVDTSGAKCATFTSTNVQPASS